MKMKSYFVLLTGILSLLYLLNIGVGLIELIPDNIPLIGNLDEATATVLLLNCLRYFGITWFDVFDQKAGRSGKP